MPGGREIEIKMRLKAGQPEKFTTLDALKGADSRRTNFRTTYFEDDKQDLARNGFELRIRTEGAHHVQTLKSGHGFERGEWETSVEAAAPSAESLKRTPAAKFTKRLNKLRPLFCLDVDRRIWSVERGGATTEVALDVGEISANNRHEPIYEAELELKSGSPEMLFDLAMEIAGEAEAPLSFVSKGTRGYRLARGVATTPEHELELRLDADVTVEAAFAQIAEACLRQFSINEERLGADMDAEAVHQGRVAIRRLRAAFSMFKPVVRGPDAEKSREELKWISDLLGRARDLDVFIDGPLAKIALEHPGVPGLEELAQHICAMRDTARERLGAGLRSERFRAMLLAVVRCVHIGEWTQSSSATLREQQFLDFAASELDRRFRKVTKKAKAVRGSDALKRHRVRIQAKKLRYMAEFVAPLLSPSETSETLRELKKLQDLLGLLNDAIAAERLVAGVADDADRPAVTFAACLVRQEEAPPRKILRRAIKSHKKLKALRPFWRGTQTQARYSENG